jgi:hypothetical protein
MTAPFPCSLVLSRFLVLGFGTLLHFILAARLPILVLGWLKRFSFGVRKNSHLTVFLNVGQRIRLAKKVVRGESGWAKISRKS